MRTGSQSVAVRANRTSVHLLVVAAFLFFGGLASAGSASAAFVHSGTVSAEFGKDGTLATSFGLSDVRFAIDQVKQRLT